MPKATILCYEVWLNGKRLCRAGAAGHGVLTAMLSWVRRDPAERPKPSSVRSWIDGHTNLHVGGLFGDELLDWVRNRRVRVGDTIRVRILRGPAADPPAARRAWDRGSLATKRRDLRNLEASARRLRAEIRRLTSGTRSASRPARARPASRR